MIRACCVCSEGFTESSIETGENGRPLLFSASFWTLCLIFCLFTCVCESSRFWVAPTSFLLFRRPKFYVHYRCRHPVPSSGSVARTLMLCFPCVLCCMDIPGFLFLWWTCSPPPAPARVLNPRAPLSQLVPFGGGLGWLLYGIR